MNGKFEQKYGMSWKDMDTDSRMQAIMSEIFDLRIDLEPVKDACKKVTRHEVYWKITGIIVGGFTLALIGLFVKVIFHA